MSWRDDPHFSKLTLGEPADTFTDNVFGASFTVGTEASNKINVAVQLTDSEGQDLTRRNTVQAYLAGDANGDSLATAPSGAVAIGTDGLKLSSGGDSKIIFGLTCESDGDIDIDITESGTPTIYLVIVLPSGKLVISPAITFA